MPIYDAVTEYKKRNTDLVVIGGKEYGTGSSRDWAAKGTKLLGVKAVIAESFERIHRSNLIGMGVLPLQFINNINRKNLDLKGSELFSVIDLENEIISKPKNRSEALEILRKLNGKTHFLISSVCISKNGSMIWHYTDKAELRMKTMTEDELKLYLSKIEDEKLYAYNVYQIEGEGKNLFNSIKGDMDTIMGLPIKKIKEYLSNLK